MENKSVLLKVHESYRWIVAICDKDLVGKILSEGIMQLDLTGPFFAGEEVSEEELKEEVWRCSLEDANFNIVGEKSIELVKKFGLIDDSGIRMIRGVPFALILA